MIKPFLVSIAIPLWMALSPASVQAQSPVGTLHGVTVNADGTPIASAPVTIHGSEDGTARTIISGFDGAFSVSNLKPGQYEVKASKGELHSLPVTVDLQAQQDLNVDLALVSPIVAKQLDAMKARIRQELEVELTKEMNERIDQRLEAELKNRNGAEQPTTPAAHGDLVATLTKDPSQIPIVAATPAKPDLSKAVASAAGSSSSAQDSAGTGQPASAPAAPAVDNQTPFAFGDFTWLNGSPRNKDVVFDSPFFTPEVRFDTHYMEDFNQPIDHTIVGATESFRSGEVQIEQASVGGDFHWQNVRGRILLMMGLFATTTPRNDASSATASYPGNTGGVGQWDLQDAYKYVSEAYGGYHFNVQHGLNIDAGIFVSYIGLFSYYNYDNWTYQPSYVSSNTPWFFNGVRVQWYPTNKLKIEPWFINGWQSYAKYNGHPGLGGQLLWEPKEWFKLVANQYGYGQDNLGLPHTERIHTDDSIEVRYYNKPESLGISKMAFSLTGDAGGQYGGGLCATCAPSQGKESFIGWMLYDRIWFHKDLFGLTLGGGEMSNWGRYLTLLPPIDGASAATGTPYFTELPGQRAHMWDSTVTLQYMPKQYITWFLEAGYRHSDVPYFAGRGGVTPPGGNNGLAQYYTCMNGTSAGTATLVAAQSACGGANNVWFPDLVRSETKLSAGVMVKF
jgi:Putative beta-barrel porin-2, OmpL-like. bbp2/Carboxypeptidase regulatory-like domain